ncbi:MAG: peptide/nickel transport system substrate-binding protein [Acidobacteriota bacterium]|jgi:peptide/nickel transport system substrate-binding protein|nr:peptide/nickel transport system substrate-binding protein [Acidobacteriota bacterium]
MRDPSVDFRVGTLAPPSGLDPRTARDTASHTLLRQIFEPPFVIRQGRTVPLLFAESLRDDRNNVRSARVADGVLFSDGTPLTAEIVARSLAKTSAVTDQATVRHEGDRVVFELKQPNPRFDLLLASTSCCVVLEKSMQLLGTGPFMFERPPILRQLQAATEVRLVRNPHSKRTVAMQSVTFVIYTVANLLEACEHGNVDFTAALTSLHAAKIPLGVVYPSIQNGVSTAFLSFNTASPQLADKRLRRALALAIDKTAIAKHSFEKNPLAFVAKDILPPAIDAVEVDLFPHNLVESQRILADPSIRKPDRLRMLIPWAPRPYAPNPGLIGDEIARQLRALGVGVEVTPPRSSDDYYAAIAAGRYELVFSGWIPDTPDPADTYESLLSSKMIPRVGSTHAAANNLSRIESEALDRAIATFRVAPTAENKSAVRKAVQDEVPLVPILKGQAVVVLSRRVRSFEHAIDGVYALDSLTITK